MSRKKTKPRKSIRQATHPIPAKRIEKDKKKYDRKKDKEKVHREIDDK